ncbi:protein GrpE [Bacteroidia bacterium]|nr:protein GrpE [Bacteroidia bacterium]
MKANDFEDILENDDLPADNLADGLTNQQPEDESQDTPPEDSANTAENELAQVKDAYVRLMAEYDNYRKRTMKEKSDLIKNGGEKTLVGLLPVVDDFQRALETIDKAPDLAAVKEGVDLIYQKFRSYLQQNGVKAIEAIGQPFDADLFEAIATVPAQKEEQKDTVMDDVQTGYILNDKVIRHAKVVVAN